MTATRRRYTEAELRRVENCVRRNGNLRALAKALKRNYDALWRFVNKRGGLALARARSDQKEALATKIRALHSRLQRKRKIGRTTTIEIATKLNCDRRIVAEVLGDIAYTRASSAGTTVRLSKAAQTL